jgi:hypothetical protein
MSMTSKQMFSPCNQTIDSAIRISLQLVAGGGSMQCSTEARHCMVAVMAPTHAVHTRMPLTQGSRAQHTGGGGFTSRSQSSQSTR